MLGISNKIKVLDIFSGAGGLSEGFIQAGFHVIASVEIDRYAVATQIINHNVNKTFKTEVISGDIRDTEQIIKKFTLNGITNFDVIIGGPPCQGFSRSNMKTKNRFNPNNHLVWHFLKIVNKYNPMIVVIENVADMINFEQGAWVNEIVNVFKELQYKAEIIVLNAADFGVPQTRKRTFIIASKKNGPKIIHPTKKIINPDHYVTVWDAISDLPELKNGASIDSLPYSKNEPQNLYQKKMRIKTNGLVYNNIVTKNSELVIRRYKHIPQGGNWRNIPVLLMFNYKNKDKCHQWIYLRLMEDKPAVTITNFRKNMLIHPREERGLSVREAARLQSFPDHFNFIGGLNSQQQQVANAVPPLLAKAIGKVVRKMIGK